MLRRRHSRNVTRKTKVQGINRGIPWGKLKNFLKDAKTNGGWVHDSLTFSVLDHLGKDLFWQNKVVHGMIAFIYFIFKGPFNQQAHNVWSADQMLAILQSKDSKQTVIKYNTHPWNNFKNSTLLESLILLLWHLWTQSFLFVTLLVIAFCEVSAITFGLDAYCFWCLDLTRDSL